MAIIAVCIFNNGHYDVIIPLLKIDTAIRANCDCYCCGGACNDVNVATAMVPVVVVLFCPFLQGAICSSEKRWFLDNTIF